MGDQLVHEQRRRILDMLAEAKITADEAERLIAALDKEQPPAPASPKGRPKYLRVLVHADDSTTEGTTRINVRVPLQLLRAGVRLTSLIPPVALERANTELEKNGVPIDLTQLKPQQLEELIDQLDEVSIDVDDPGAKVKVFCE
ncbi:SHOCT-like domain-containing protein [Dactylosporangium sp. CS-047395]|uniref:SHOCT-like domain-containing protein n=1 Tax=Dactylosporangium sp. CS-047395 TaxID=3239936 RepID=UPI003D900256